MIGAKSLKLPVSSIDGSVAAMNSITSMGKAEGFTGLFMRLKTTATNGVIRFVVNTGNETVLGKDARFIDIYGQEKASSVIDWAGCVIPNNFDGYVLFPLIPLGSGSLSRNPVNLANPMNLQVMFISYTGSGFDGTDTWIDQIGYYKGSDYRQVIAEFGGVLPEIDMTPLYDDRTNVSIRGVNATAIPEGAYLHADLDTPTSTERNALKTIGSGISIESMYQVRLTDFGNVRELPLKGVAELTLPIPDTIQRDKMLACQIDPEGTVTKLDVAYTKGDSLTVYTTKLGTIVLVNFSSKTLLIDYNRYPISPLAETVLGNNVLASPEYYVSIFGSDRNTGTRDNPFRTLEYAKMAVNHHKEAVNADMSIVLMQGTYVLNQTFSLGIGDMLQNGKKLSIRNDTGSTPVISGGTSVTNWQKTTYNGKELYKARVTSVDNVRQLFVNNEVRNLAKSGNMSWSWMIENNIPNYGFIIPYGSEAKFDNINNIRQLELVFPVEWRIFIYRADYLLGEYIKMQDNFSIVSTQIKNLPTMTWFLPQSGKTPLYVQNDISLIQNPGDFCYDEASRDLYYFPMPGENMKTAACFVPRLENMIEISGDTGNATDRVENIEISGITFMHGALNVIAHDGLSIMQSSVYTSSDVSTAGGYSSATIEGNIRVKNAQNIAIQDCRFEHTSATAIRLYDNASDVTITRNIFKEIGDGAITIDKCSDITFSNNIIRKSGLVNLSSSAVLVFSAKNITIEHNDISDTPYTGVSLGWGWGYAGEYAENNNVLHNRIGNVMQTLRDGGGIYTLDKQYNSIIEGNYIFNLGVGNGIYNDEGSRGFVVRNNVVQNKNSNGVMLRSLVANRLETNRDSTGVKDLSYENNYTNDTSLTVNEVVSIDEQLGENLPDTTDGTQIVKLNIKVFGTKFEPNADSEDQWSDGAKSIIALAGIDADYSHLIGQINQTPVHLGMSYPDQPEDEDDDSSPSTYDDSIFFLIFVATIAAASIMLAKKKVHVK
jgi:hypothetical protein